LKITTPLILVSTTVFKFFVFDHENAQIKIKKITKIKKNANLPTLPLRESVTGTTPFFYLALYTMGSLTNILVAMKKMSIPVPWDICHLISQSVATGYGDNIFLDGNDRIKPSPKAVKSCLKNISKASSMFICFVFPDTLGVTYVTAWQKLNLWTALPRGHFSFRDTKVHP
jgi:hypothetical protein